MKHQYVGDLNDYRKYALLRALSAEGRNRIGICWMLTVDDSGSDGNKLAYLEQPDKHRHFDPELFDILSAASAAPDWRRLQTIEESGVIAAATYFDELLTDDVAARHTFMETCASTLPETDLIFFDPDNGLEVSLSKGRKGSSKYLYLDEVARFYAAEKSVLIYQHFPRIERAAFVAASATRLRSVAPGAAIWAFTSSNVVFLLLIHPKSPARLAIAALEAAERWDERFVTGRYLGGGEIIDAEFSR